MTPPCIRVFVSSTWLDLQPERRAVETALQSMRATKFIGMEYFGSRDEATRRASLDEVDRSDVYIGIFGGRYGSGITEEEYKRARLRGLPCYIYFKDARGIAADAPESDLKKERQLTHLKKQLRRDHTTSEFSNTDSLAAKVTADLHRWLFDEYLTPKLETAAQGHVTADETQSVLDSIKDFSALDQDLLARLRGAGYVIAQGAGSVAIGGDAIRNVIVTGSHSQVFVGNFERLRDAYINAESVFTRVRLDRFAGRNWLIAEVDRFLHGSDRGYFVLEAKAGLGKTTFLAHLVKERGLIHHFVELTPGADGISPALKNLATQLIRGWELNPYNINEVLPGAATRPDFLESVVFEAARRRDEIRPGEKIVLVVDALDEAGTPPGLNVLGLPRVLPKGVYFIVSQRPVEVALAVDGPRRVLHLEATDEQNITDMSLYLVNATSWSGVSQALRDSGYSADQFVAMLLQKCQGVWIYLHYVVGEIERGERSPLNLDNLPQGVWQYYAQYWHRWRKENIDDWDRQLLLLSTLAAAQEDVSLQLLCMFAGVEERPAVRRLLEEPWRPFLVVQEARYRLYHASLREFLNGRTLSGLRENEQVFVSEIAEATRNAHSRIADYYLSIWGGLEKRLVHLKNGAKRDVDGRYGLRHLVLHLESAGRYDELHSLLQIEWQAQNGDPKRALFENAWYAVHEQVGDTSSYLNDVAVAWQVAARQSANLVARGQIAATIGLEARYALLTASVNSLARNVPPELLADLVQNGIWPPAQGLAFAQRVPEAMQRAQALVKLAPLLSVSLLMEAIAAARAIADRSARFQALKGLGPYLAEPARGKVQREALGLAALTFVQGKDATELLELAPQLPEWLLEKVVELVTGPETPIQSWTLRVLANYLSQPLLKRVREAARRIKDAMNQAALLTELARYFSGPMKQEVLEEAFAAVLKIESERDRARALGAFSRLLAAGQESELSKALDVAQEIQAPGARAYLLTEMAANLSSSLLSRAVAQARDIESNRRRAKALANLAMRLPKAERVSLLQEAVSEAQFIQPDSIQTSVLVWLTQLLSESGHVEAAWDAATGMKPGPQKAEALVLIAPLLKGNKRETSLTEALKAAQTIQHRWRRASALTRIAPHLPQPLQETALQEALAVTTKMRRPGQRTHIVNTVRMLRDPHLEAPKEEPVPEPSLSDKLKAARQIKDNDERAVALVELAPHLPHELLKEALKAAVGIKNETYKVDALMVLSPLLSGVSLRRALTAAQKLRDYNSRHKVLTQLVVRLEDTGLLEEALAKSKLLSNESRIETLIRLLPKLPEPAKELVHQFLPWDIDSNSITHKQLIQLAPRLPEDCLEKCVEAALPGWGGDVLVLGVAGLAPHLKGPFKERVLKEALAVAQGGMEPHLEELLALVPHLPEPVKLKALQVELEDARARAPRFHAAWALGLIAPHLPEPTKSEVLREGLTFARALKHPIERSEAITNLLDHVSKSMKDEFLSEAFQAVQAIKIPEDRSDALRAVLPHLPEPFRIKVLNKELVRARATRNERKRKTVLSWLVPYLASSAETVSLRDAITEARATVGLGCTDATLGAKDVHRPDPYTEWHDRLRSSSFHTRPELLADLRSKIRDTAEIGGSRAILEVFHAIQDAGRWWP